jgi:hypothetical protein
MKKSRNIFIGDGKQTKPNGLCFLQKIKGLRLKKCDEVYSGSPTMFVHIRVLNESR